MSLIFVAAPFTGRFNKHNSDIDFQVYLDKLMVFLERELCMKSNIDVYNAHRREDWGKLLFEPPEITWYDYQKVADCDLLVGVIDGMPSAGVSMEIAWASLLQKPILLLVSKGVQVPERIRDLQFITRIETIEVREKEANNRTWNRWIPSNLLVAKCKNMLAATDSGQHAAREPKYGTTICTKPIVYVVGEQLPCYLTSTSIGQHVEIYIPKFSAKSAIGRQYAIKQDLDALNSSSLVLVDVRWPPNGNTEIDLGWASIMMKNITIFSPQGQHDFISPLIFGLPHMYKDKTPPIRPVEEWQVHYHEYENQQELTEKLEGVLHQFL